MVQLTAYKITSFTKKKKERKRGKVESSYNDYVPMKKVRYSVIQIASLLNVKGLHA